MVKGAEKKNAIVLSMFGTSVEQALPGLLRIRDRMIERFPQTVVRIAFSSPIIRRIWRQRAMEDSYRSIHPEVTEDILNVRSPEAVIAGLLEEAFQALVVQLVQVAPTRESDNPGAALKGPGRLAIGRPALGTHGSPYPCSEDIAAVARSLSPDAALVKREKAALFYMGHGDKQDSTSRVYQEFVVEMGRQYPDITTVMSLVEKGPALAEVVRKLKNKNVEKLLLKPFLIAAGDHVRKDMIGGGANTLKTRLENEGFRVVPVIEGLGENPAFADIFVRHTADAAHDAGIELR